MSGLDNILYFNHDAETVVALEDCLLYLLPNSVFQALLQSSSTIRQYFRHRALEDAIAMAELFLAQVQSR